MTQKKITALTGSAQTHAEFNVKGTGDNDFANIVPVLSGQIGGRPANTISAKNLHIALGAGNDFSTWIKLRIDEYGFVLGHDYVVFDSSDFRNHRLDFEKSDGGWKSKRGGDRSSKDYLLSLDMAKEVAMVERNEQGRAVRRYFIRCEEELSRSAPEIAAQLRQQLRARITAANLYKPMCAALDAARAEQGKETQGYRRCEVRQ
ncbi:antA/AntB antirepressor family protein [Pantoea sp. S61]|nr:antA/AntB antirepressor family protein [Pantoea sp. S61]